MQAAVAKELGALPASRPASRAATTVHVSSNGNSGSGTLRDALSNAVDGDIIDLGSLHGTLMLSSPLIPAANVTIKGPGRDILTIDANHIDRAITSSHSLKVSNITIANGATPKTATPIGGCLLISGQATLNNVTLSNCTADGSAGIYAYGGAIAVVGGSLTADSSTFNNNSAIAPYYAAGGAIVVIGSPAYYDVSISNSTLSGNSVTAGIEVIGGAIAVAYSNQYDETADVTLTNTTVSGNTLTATSIPPYYNATQKQTYYYGNAAGAGVWAHGANITLTGSHITNNNQTSNAAGFGGGVYAANGQYENTTTTTYYPVGGAVSVTGSTISGNSATSVYQNTYGGGLQGAGDITIDTSAISGNKAQSQCYGCYSAGGGVESGKYTYNLAITGSTLSGNSVSATGTFAYTAGGGLSTKFQNFGTAVTITNSTISGNTTDTANTGPASTYGAGIYQQASYATGSMTLNNSTVAFNTSRDFGAGIATNGYTGLTLNSTIVADNTSTTYAAVSDIAPRAMTFTVAGDYSLVQTDPTSYGVTFSGTHNIVGSDPLLKPLANNGGPTQTHALDPASPAVDAGSNPLALTTDQRGVPYARVVGAAADIGAYELDTDHIFGNGFE